MQLKFHKPNFTVGLILGLLTGLIIAGSLLISSAKHALDQQHRDYGNALSAMAARQAVDATFNHDLVRLQVILQDTATNARVSLATIHDVENNLLVQAGEPQFGNPASLTFTHPIILHDSVAGYVSITTAQNFPGFSAAINLSRAMIIVCLLVAIWAIHQLKLITLVRLPKPDKAHQNEEEKSQDNNDTTQPQNTQDETLGLNNDLSDTLANTQDFPDVFSVVHIKNLDVLKQQLNGENLRATLGRLEKIIRDVMALYGGTHFQLIGNHYILTFKAYDSAGEALFRATCSAHLVLELGGIVNNIPLDLAALVSSNAGDIRPENLPISGLILEGSAGEDELINQRIEFIEVGEASQQKVVSGFHNPFQSLIDKQHKQLIQRI